MIAEPAVMFRDRRTLDLSYVPEELPCREQERKQLLESLLPAAAGEHSRQVVISGEYGVGKTALAKRVGRDLASIARENRYKFRYIHVNCRHKSPLIVLADIVWKSFGRRIPTRGCSLEELLQHFRYSVIEEGVSLLIALDEADSFWYYGRDGEVLLYNLVRFSDDSLDSDLPSLSLMLVCRLDFLLKETLHGDTLALLRDQVYLRKYTLEQLREITEYRASKALYREAYDGEIIDLIARVAEPFGSARVAIQALRLAAEKAAADGLPRIYPEYVREAAESVCPRDGWGISELTTEQATILLAVASLLKSREKPYVKTGDVWSQYSTMCKVMGVRRVSYSQFLRELQYLEKCRYIVAKRGGSRGNTMVIDLDGVPAERLAKDLEELLLRAR
ncbi:MAG: hypothetical protein DRN99_00745 [Thermoproteota archaeon]|nr:MAG: hypothetical protein DRN99_00745 [Candidatus Korarchaeota archaeon]